MAAASSSSTRGRAGRRVKRHAPRARQVVLRPSEVAKSSLHEALQPHLVDDVLHLIKAYMGEDVLFWFAQLADEVAYTDVTVHRYEAAANRWTVDTGLAIPGVAARPLRGPDRPRKLMSKLFPMKDVLLVLTAHQSIYMYKPGEPDPNKRWTSIENEDRLRQCLLGPRYERSGAVQLGNKLVFWDWVQIQAYDMDTRTWHELASPGYGLDVIALDSALVAVNLSVHHSEPGETSVYDQVSNTWSAGPTMDRYEVGGHALVTCPMGDQLFVFSRDGGQMLDLDSMHLHWTRLPLPAGFTGLVDPDTAAAAEGFVFVQMANDVLRYNTVTGEWSSDVSPVPGAPWGGKLAAFRL